MQYVGGKFRLAKHVERLILQARGSQTAYVEPFLGGAATFSRLAPHFATARGFDVVEDLILMWEAVRDGWVPPSEVSEDEYRALRNADPSALRGFVGFGCSFGGKWFGGYGRKRIAGGKPATEPTLAPGAARSVMRQAAGIRHAEFGVADYRDVLIAGSDVVYCDPPYAGTTGYTGTPPFSTDEFWHTAARWASLGATVLVSEHSAPSPWVRVWERPMPNYLRGDSQKSAQRTEAVFALPHVANQLAGRDQGAA